MTIKLGIFTDSHYSSAERTCGRRYNSRSLSKIKEAYQIFEDAGCDLVLCLGDLTDTESTYEKECENLRACAAVMDASLLPTLCMMGNHDAFVFMVDAFYNILGESHKPHTVRTEDVILIFLDACHFASGAHYQPGDSDWTDTYYPHPEELRELLASADKPVCVFLHQNIDPSISEDHRLSNDAQIRQILEECGVVQWVISGHYHPGMESVHHGIHYLTLPALCEQETAEAVRILEIGYQ